MEPEGSLPRLQEFATSLYPEPDKSSICPHPTSWRSVLISSHLRLGLASRVFPSGFPTKTQYTPLVSPIRATCPAYLSRFNNPNDFGEEYGSLSSSLHSLPHFLLPCPARPKYSPQRRILKHPQPTFLPHCERPSFTPIQNNRQNYISVYLNFYIVRQQTGRQKILHRMKAGTPCF